MRKIKRNLSNKTVRTVFLATIFRTIVVALIIIITTKMITEPAIRISIASLLIIIYTIIDSVAFKRFFKQEAEQYLGWQLLWVYPSNQIITTIMILTICIIVLLMIIKTIGHVQNDSIIIGVTTGIISSGIIVLFSEFSNNHKNNLKRLAVLNDYFNVIHFYKEDIDLNKKRIERCLEEGELHLIEMDNIIKTITELGESAGLISDYTNIELQAIAWEIIEYGDLLCNTIKNHSELLYLDEIKSLNNICDCFSKIKNRYISSLKINEVKTVLQQQTDNFQTEEYIASVNDKNTEESLHLYLYDISKEKEAVILCGVITLIAYFDQNMKLLNRYVLYIDDKELRHFNHLSKKVDRYIAEVKIH